MTGTVFGCRVNNVYLGGQFLEIPEYYWQQSSQKILPLLESSPSGLSEGQAQERLAIYGHNSLKKQSRQSGLILFLNQFKSPIIIILICASIVSAALQDFADTAIILVIIVASGALSFFQEYHAANTVAKLLRTVKTKATLVRDGVNREVFIDELVPGDIILLSAGSIIPADCRLLDTKDFFVNEALLTGETFPVEKNASALPESHSLAQRKNTVFMGTSVESGLATAVAVKTGSSTENRPHSRPPGAQAAGNGL